MHWAHQYIGRKWVSGARGPDTFDCWGLLWWILREHYGKQVPEYPGVNARDLMVTTWLIHTKATSSEWTRLDKPVDGCAVALSKHRLFHHVGVYIELDGGLVLHAMDKGNVVAQSIQALRNSAFRRIEFYQYHGTHS